VGLRLSRRGEAVEIRYEAAGRAPELAAMVYLPPDREVLAGVMCAAPESEGFTVAFHDLRVSAGDLADAAEGP
jgi:regulation of enolase protein 1 (concanavalin A-like superfamily)